MSREKLCFKYRFVLPDGSEKEFPVELDPGTLGLMNIPEGPYPGWTALGHNQCPNCPLDADKHEHCPAAVSLVDAVDFFRDSISHEQADVFVESPAREYHSRISMQEGLSSLVGLSMAASGCPHLGRLKPMARFHLPFAGEEETIYRVVSMYLAAQYFRHRRGGEPDWEMKDLVKMYDEIRVVNRHFVRRLSGLDIKDASLNAIIKLDCFAISVGFSINQNMIDDMEYLFAAYF
jgi:hypothetical protein